MQAEIAIAGAPTTSCIGGVFGISSSVSGPATMTSARSTFRPLVMGAVITLAQIALAVLLLAPEGSLSSRYYSLNQHDSYWFMNIVNRGYQTIVPPIDHKVMEVSNTAFFPAYPALAALLRYGFGIDTGYALLI